MTNDKLQKMKELFQLVNEGVSKKEFLDNFKILLEYVVKIEKQNGAEMDGMWKKLDEKLTELESEQYETLNELNTKVSKRISEVKNGIDGKDGENGRDGIDGIGINGENGKDGSPDTPEQIREKLESLEGNERLDISAIKGLLERIELLEKRPSTSGGGNVSSSRGVQYYDLSSSLNGVLKSFSLPAFNRILDIKLSSKPVLRPTTDYTVNGSTFVITFTSEVLASTDLATGQSLIVLYAEN